MRVKTREELPWLYYPEFNSVRVINSHFGDPIRNALLRDAAAAHLGEQRTGSTYYDSTGQRNGTLSGGYSWATPSGNGGHYLDLNGTTGYATMGGRILTTTANWTLSVWMRPDVITGTRIAALNGHAGANGYGIIMDASIIRGVLGGVSFVGGAATSAGEWKQVIFTRASGTSALYVNGVSAGSNSAIPLSPQDSASVGVNAVTLSGFFDGGLAEVLWLPRQATTDEIAWLADPSNSLLA